MKTWRTEYRNFIRNKILPLMGIKLGNDDEKSLKISNRVSGELVWQEDDHLYFSSQSKGLFGLEVKIKIPDETLKLSRSILSSFFRFSEYYLSGKRQHSYNSSATKEINYNIAVQNGIAGWIVGNNTEKLEKLFNLLEKWSVKTYEGKKVTLCFLIDPNAKSGFDELYGNWLDFMDDDFVAVLTDCIDSAIKLDSDCNFVEYLSITDNNLAKQKYSCFVPIRFANVIENFVKDKVVGVFLLNNGDIIIAKNQRIVLVKRNLKWLNFSYEAFNNVLISNLKKTISEKFKENIYASMLDVSFSHTGGIISVISGPENIVDLDGMDENNKIISFSDYLLDGGYSKLEDYFKNLNKNRGETNQITQEDIKRRILKRKVIDNLIKCKSFNKVNRKLRSELISLDGACILSLKGEIVSVGAIIKNDSGSSGGGRGAAARKLSMYGFSIKISTDGYVELYIKGNLIYSIK